MKKHFTTQRTSSVEKTSASTSSVLSASGPSLPLRPSVENPSAPNAFAPIRVISGQSPSLPSLPSVETNSPSALSASSAVEFSYQYNDANQRTRRTDSDDSYRAYEYDSLGQVTSGKHYWPDAMPVAGQQFEYAYDDIGNRRRTREGGDATGAGLRTAHYTVNNLNQYTQRDVPSAADIIGIAHPNASVSVNAQSAYRRGEYYHKELAIDNTSAPDHALGAANEKDTACSEMCQDAVPRLPH